MKTLITQEQVVILLNSQAIENYPNFKQLLLLTENKANKSITDDMINKIDLDKDTERLIKSGAFLEIFQAARSEWIAIGDPDLGNKRCSLCNTKNKLIYYIKNKYNKANLNVGSSCIKHFLNLKDENGEELDVNKIKKLAVRVSRKQKFNETFPDFDSKKLQYIRLAKESKYLINSEIDNRFNHAKEKLDKLKKDYLDGKGTDEYLQLIFSQFNKLNKICLTEIPEQNKKLANNEFACTKEIADWLSRNSKKKTLEKIQNNNSCIDGSTIIDVAYLPFVENILDKNKAITKDVFSEIWIENIKGSIIQNVYVKINNRYFSNIIFCCSLEKFMKKLGNLIFLKEKSSKINFAYLFSEVFEFNENENYVIELFRILNELFRDKYHFICSFDEGVFELGKFFIIDIKNSSFYQIRNINNIVKHLLKYCDKEKEIFIYLSETNYLKLLSFIKISESNREMINECQKSFVRSQKI